MLSFCGTNVMSSSYESVLSSFPLVIRKLALIFFGLHDRMSDIDVVYRRELFGCLHGPTERRELSLKGHIVFLERWV